MKSLKSKFLYDLGNAYKAEYRIAQALPQLIKPGIPEDLKLAMLSHAREAAGHVTLVKQLFECFGQSADWEPISGDPEPKKGPGKHGSSVSRYGALISALKMVKQCELPDHGCQREWEIASYGYLHEWANLLGTAEGAELLERLLEEDAGSNSSQG